MARLIVYSCIAIHLNLLKTNKQKKHFPQFIKSYYLILLSYDSYCTSLGK